jgi:hypothetical protein
MTTHQIQETLDRLHAEALAIDSEMDAQAEEQAQREYLESFCHYECDVQVCEW